MPSCDRGYDKYISAIMIDIFKICGKILSMPRLFANATGFLRARQRLRQKHRNAFAADASFELNIHLSCRLRLRACLKPYYSSNLGFCIPDPARDDLNCVIAANSSFLCYAIKISIA
jgi:hypothetical protein